MSLGPTIGLGIDFDSNPEWTPAELGPLAWYKGTAAEGGLVLADSSGNALDMVMSATAPAPDNVNPRFFPRNWLYGGAPCAQFIQGDQNFATAPSAASLSITHQPAGATWWFVTAPYEALILFNSFGNVFALGPGEWLEWSAVLENITFYTGNGVGAVIAYVSPIGSCPYGVPFSLVKRASAAAGYELYLNGALVASGGYGTASAANSPFPFTIGNYANGVGSWSTQRVREFGVIGRVVTNAELTLLQAYVAALMPTLPTFASLLLAGPIQGLSEFKTLPVITVADILIVGDSLPEGATCGVTGGSRLRLYNNSLVVGFPVALTQRGPITSGFFPQDFSLAIGGRSIRQNFPGGGGGPGLSPFSIPTNANVLSNHAGPGKPYNTALGLLELFVNNLYGIAVSASLSNDNADDLFTMWSWWGANVPGIRLSIVAPQNTFSTADHRNTTAAKRELAAAIYASRSGSRIPIAPVDMQTAIPVAADTCDLLHRNAPGSVIGGDLYTAAVRNLCGFP